MQGKKEKKQDGQDRTCPTCINIEIKAGTPGDNPAVAPLPSMRRFFDSAGHGPSSLKTVQSKRLGCPRERRSLLSVTSVKSFVDTQPFGGAHLIPPDRAH